MDVSGHLELTDVKENNNTGRPGAEDADTIRSRENLWRGALLSALKQLGNIITEISKINRAVDLVYVPELVRGFANVRET